MMATEIRLDGQLRSPNFIDWICHRAELLNLTGWVTAESTTAISIVVAGPPALIEAMEMACSLGPMDVQVDRIVAHSTTLNERLNSFQRR